jgi:hypothetical protein
MLTKECLNFSDCCLAIAAPDAVVNPDFDNEKLLLSVTVVDRRVVLASGEAEFEKEVVDFRVPNLWGLLYSVDAFD